eukprot:TRINITY_DN9993_c0_g1_i1.p1 TRINITY_DN9993_c0_g1~~TRINITY_DN9993_c0_g1_i1.p1  ORF type:complete len:214 (+),score=23.41 TRINITY_DN9993_c0_g1_i1:63-704(+)
MELELGLTLPTPPTTGFDLNNHLNFSQKDAGFGLPFGSNKRDFDEAFEKTRSVIQTLPLFWKDQASDDDEGDEDGDTNECLKKRNPFLVNKGAIVGWPPIKSSRKLPYRECQDLNGADGPASLYVKVKMEGVAIGRKVNLVLHRSYETLTVTLNRMFGKYKKCPSGRKGSGGEPPRYTLTYQDKEGDWLLVGDVPWEAFIHSVQRLKIQRSGD